MKHRVLMCSSNIYSTVFSSIYKYFFECRSWTHPVKYNLQLALTNIFWQSNISHPKSTSQCAVCNSGKFWHVAICVRLNAVLKIKWYYTQQGRFIAITQQRASAEYDKSLTRETGSFRKNHCSVVFRPLPLLQHSAAASIPRLSPPFTITKSRWSNKLLKKIKQIGSIIYIICFILLR